MTHYRDWDRDSDFDWDCELERGPDRRVRQAPSPGIAAVLSVLLPGLGQVYAGRLLAGALWFAATTLSYSAILLPGFLVHAFCVWSAYRSCRWQG